MYAPFLCGSLKGRVKGNWALSGRMEKSLGVIFAGCTPFALRTYSSCFRCMVCCSSSSSGRVAWVLSCLGGLWIYWLVLLALALSAISARLSPLFPHSHQQRNLFLFCITFLSLGFYLLLSQLMVFSLLLHFWASGSPRLLLLSCVLIW